MMKNFTRRDAEPNGSEAKYPRINLRLDRTQRAAIEDAAKRHDVSISAYARSAIVAALIRENVSPSDIDRAIEELEHELQET